jgi:hypothetical protein
MRHIVVCSEPGAFFGWPANCGLWSWSEEIVVGCTRGTYLERSSGHSVDPDQPLRGMLVRSLDAGETWTCEDPPGYPEGFAFGVEARPAAHPDPPVDFLHPDLAIRCKDCWFAASLDRGRTWQGPYALPDFGLSHPLTSRTSYLPLDRREALFFLSVKNPEGLSKLPDRAFAARTRDGGLTFEFLGWMLPDRPEIRSVMPSVVRLSDRRLVAVLRRRFDRPEEDGRRVSSCWIDAATSDDNGAAWRFLSKVADTQGSTNHNGNPPAMVRLPDGRLCVVYGFRGEGGGMRTRLSADGGQSWGREVVLRDDARTWDMGYPRCAVRPDGQVVAIYYYTTAALPQQHLAATIWDPARPGD